MVLGGVSRPREVGADAPPWTVVSGDPGADNFSRYQSVEVAPDGSIYLAGFFTGKFHGLQSTDDYGYFVEKVSPAGAVQWTTIAPTPTPTTTVSSVLQAPALVVDGRSRPFVRVCGGGCRWATLHASSRPQSASLLLPAPDRSDEPVGAAGGGVVTMRTGSGYAVSLLDAQLQSVWTTPVDALVDSPASNVDDTAIVVRADASIWVIGAHKQSPTVAQDALSLVHVSSAGTILGSVEHVGYMPFHDFDAPSFVLAETPSWMSIGVRQGAANHVLNIAGDSGQIVGTVSMVLPSEQIATSVGNVDCAGVDLAQPVGVLGLMTPQAAAISAVVAGGTRLVVLARCETSPGSGSAANLLLTYQMPVAAGGALVRLGGYQVSAAVNLTAFDADAGGHVVATGGSANGTVFIGDVVSGPVTPGTERAVVIVPSELPPTTPPTTPTTPPTTPPGDPASGFKALAPVRLFDTRPDQATGEVEVLKVANASGGVLQVKVTGVGGVPAAGVGALSLNVTAVDPGGAGFVTVYPCGERPSTSNVNFGAGQTVANAVIAPVSPDRDVVF